MQNWSDKALKDYIKDIADTPGPLVFQHIPKTAGSSLVHEISRSVGGYKPITVDYSTTRAVQPMDDMFMEAVERFIAAYDPETVKSASGHLRRKHIDRLLEAIPDAKLVTVLRNPVDRMISDYRYQCTDQHPPHKEFIERFPRIEDYVNFRGTADKHWHFMIDDNDMSIEDGIDFIEKRFAFVGLKEMYPMSVNVMMLLRGHDVMPRVHKRSTKPNAANAVEITDELVAQITEKNRKDFALFEHFRKKLVEKRDEWRKLKEDVNAMRALALTRDDATPEDAPASETATVVKLKA